MTSIREEQDLVERLREGAAQWRADGKPDPFGNRYDCARSDLIGGDRTDDALANEAYMELHEPLGTMVKDRIRWLSRQAIALLDRLVAVEKERDEARGLLAEMVERSLSYQGGNIVIPTGGHGNAIALVRRARTLISKDTPNDRD